MTRVATCTRGTPSTLLTNGTVGTRKVKHIYVANWFFGAFITGAGLKTAEAVQGALAEPVLVEPSISSFEEAMAQRRGALPTARG